MIRLILSILGASLTFFTPVHAHRSPRPTVYACITTLKRALPERPNPKDIPPIDHYWPQVYKLAVAHARLALYGQLSARRHVDSHDLAMDAVTQLLSAWNWYDPSRSTGVSFPPYINYHLRVHIQRAVRTAGQLVPISLAAYLIWYDQQLYRHQTTTGRLPSFEQVLGEFNIFEAWRTYKKLVRVREKRVPTFSEFRGQYLPTEPDL